LGIMKVVIFLVFVSILNISLAKEESSSLTIEKSFDGIDTLTRNTREARRKSAGRKSKVARRKRKIKVRARKCKKGKEKCRRSNQNKGLRGRKSKVSRRKNKTKASVRKCTKGKKKCRKSKNNGRTNKKKRFRKGKKKGSPISKIQGGRQTSCNSTALILKMKRFNKIQTEARLAKRITGFATQMANKKNTSSTTFDDSLTAINESTNGGKSCGSGNSSAEEKAVYDKLKNCSKTAAAACNAGNSSVTVDTSLAETCAATSEKFVKDFKNCLTDVSKACACVLALTEPESKCLDFKSMSDALKEQKQRCTKGTNPGSFGDCRKQERMAAKFANKCKHTPCSMTTASPSGRRRDFRFNFEKLLNKH